MAKPKSPSFLSPKRLLSKPEYKQYKEQKQTSKRIMLQRGIEQGQSSVSRLQRQEAYRKSRTGRIGSRIAQGFSILQRGGITRATYGGVPSMIPQTQTQSVIRTGSRGRPRGSYDSRYAAYGGVYGYRKVLNATLRQQRMEQLRNAAINPQQMEVLRQIEARRQFQASNPEGRIIPDTAGQVDLKQIWKDIDDASNIIG